VLAVLWSVANNLGMTWKPPKCHYTAQWGMISSVTYVRTDYFFDLTVPGAGHYLAEGIWHHNTGKSLAILHKIHRCAIKYKKMRALIVRQTRESLTQSALKTFEGNVLSPDWYQRIAAGCQRRVRQSYHYPKSGSEIVVGGLDKPSKVMSTEYDIIYVNEARETTEEACEDLSSRLRNGAMPYQQLLLDTNPDAPTHWIKRRALDGKLELWPTRHEDNPRYWDAVNECWTPDGARYMERLERLTGVRFLRLRKGIWAGAEGQIYDEWDEAVHLIEPFEIPPDWPRYCGCDFGFTNPYVYQWWAQDPDGRIYLYRELYGATRIVSDWAKEINRYSQGEQIEWTVADWDAEDRATLAAEGIWTRAATKSVKPGIEAVQLRLRKAGDGKPRLFIMKGCTVERDPRLIEAKKPASTAEEFGGYVWAPPLPNRAPKEEPLKINDHGCFVAGTLIETDEEPRPIEWMRSGDRVLTREGYCCVLEAGLTNSLASVYEVKFSNGESLTGTGNHPIWTDNRGFIALRALRYGDTMRLASTYKEPVSCQCESTKNPTSLSSRESVFVDTPMQRIGQSDLTSFQATCTASEVSGGCTKKSGRAVAGTFLRGMLSTTRMKTPWTTVSTIWSALRKRITLSITRCSVRKRKSGGEQTWIILLAKRLLNGIDLRTERLGTKFLEGQAGLIGNPGNTSASSVVMNTSHLSTQARIDFAQTIANRNRGDYQGSMTFLSNVPFAERYLEQTGMGRPGSSVPVVVLSVREASEMMPVFNLKVESNPEYFANGVLVHNCDALRYVCAELDGLGHYSAGAWA
jgi:PBSX family phage terminase large subunit